MRYVTLILVALGLSACVKDSQETPSVGFTNYQAYLADKKRREAQLAASATPDAQISQETVASSTPPAATPTQATTPTATTETATTTPVSTEPLDATNQTQLSATGETPQAVLGASGISKENDFEAVGEQRSIESDAALIAQNRAQYTQVEATALPARSGGSGPNVVEYALSSSNQPGTQVYKRAGIAVKARHDRNCAKYASADLAQQDFLAKGGPHKDRMALDPDGDGFACHWDPRPYRKALGG